jgi:hypothetical protein
MTDGMLVKLYMWVVTIILAGASIFVCGLAQSAAEAIIK